MTPELEFRAEYRLGGVKCDIEKANWYKPMVHSS